MAKTRHIQQRMSQRGITSEILDMVERFGVCDGDKITLTKKNCQALSNLFAKLKKTADKMAEKGGYTVVACGNSLITAYRLNSFNPSLGK